LPLRYPLTFIFSWYFLRLSSCEANTECKKNISSFIFLDKKKKKKKQTERRSQPVGPQIIEYPAGTTSIPLAEAQLLLGEIDNMKGDGKYDSEKFRI
jgi:hypothetical protein